MSAAAGRDRNFTKAPEAEPEKPESGKNPPVTNLSPDSRVQVTIERLKDLTAADLDDLCDATETAIREGGGFGWLNAPERWVLENYWNGVVLIPQRFLWVGRVDGIIAGSVQLQRMPKNNEAQRFTGVLSTLFIAPWARRFGLARHLVEALEDGATRLGMKVVDATVRTTQTEAMALLGSMSYQVIGTHPFYAMVEDGFVPGRYFTKALSVQKDGAQTDGAQKEGAQKHSVQKNDPQKPDA